MLPGVADGTDTLGLHPLLSFAYLGATSLLVWHGARIHELWYCSPDERICCSIAVKEQKNASVDGAYTYTRNSLERGPNRLPTPNAMCVPNCKVIALVAPLIFQAHDISEQTVAG